MKQLVGYAAIYGSPSLPITEQIDGEEMTFIEEIMPGAFARFLRRDNIEFRDLSHSETIIASTASRRLRLYENDTGIWFILDLPDTIAARQTFAEVDAGTTCGVSIRFLPLDVAWKRNHRGIKTRMVYEARLRHVCAVKLGAYPGLTIRAIKQTNEGKMK